MTITISDEDAKRLIEAKAQADDPNRTYYGRCSRCHRGAAWWNELCQFCTAICDVIGSYEDQIK